MTERQFSILRDLDAYGINMNKASNKRAIRALPALRASLIWFKRETVRSLRQRALGAASPKMGAWLREKARKVAQTDLADLRLAYEAGRVGENRAARRFELSRVVPGIVWPGELAQQGADDEPR